MKEETLKRLEAIYKTAERAKKQDYSVYSSLKRDLELLVLSPDEYAQAVIKLARILKI